MMFVHVLGHPELPLDREAHPGNAQVLTCWNFCRLLQELNLPYCCYALTGSRLPPGGAGELQECGRPTGPWRYGNRWHRLYTARLNRALQARLPRRPGPQLIASLYGAAQADIEDGGWPVIEPMAGYDHCWTNYRVFPSYAQQHTLYASQPELTWDTRFYDAVIPHFLDPAEYQPGTGAGGYLLYLGRPAQDKGIGLARDCAAACGLPLRLAFTGYSMAEKNRLLGEAMAVLMPTLYVEPFGFVAAEAQMCGTPVITTDWGAFVETVENGVTGYRCRTRSEFAEAVRLAGRLDRGHIRALAEQRFALSAAKRPYAAYFDVVWRTFSAGGYAAPGALRASFRPDRLRGPVSASREKQDNNHGN